MENPFSKKFEAPLRETQAESEKIKEDYGRELIKNAEECLRKLPLKEADEWRAFVNVLSSDMEKLKTAKPDVYGYYLGIIKEFDASPNELLPKGFAGTIRNIGISEESIKKFTHLNGLNNLLRIEELNPPQEIRGRLGKEMKTAKSNVPEFELLPMEVAEFLRGKPSKEDYEFLERVEKIDLDSKINLYKQLETINAHRRGSIIGGNLYDDLLDNRKFETMKKNAHKLAKIYRGRRLGPDSLYELADFSINRLMKNVLSRKFSETIKDLEIKSGLKIDSFGALVGAAARYSGEKLAKFLSRSYFDKIGKLKNDYNFKISNFGDVAAGGLGKRQIVSGIAAFVAPESLVGRQFPFVTNLEPRMLKGFESQGMILASGGKAEGEPFALLTTTSHVNPGTRVS